MKIERNYNIKEEERMSLKALRNASIEEIKEQVKSNNPWTAIHIRSKYNCSVAEWLKETKSNEELVEEVWGHNPHRNIA